MQNQNDVGVTIRVTPGVQTKVGDLVIKIEGYTKPIPERLLKLHKGEEYSRDRMLADVAKVRDLLKKDKFFAPELDEPKITYDSDANTISLVLTGKVGPTVDVIVDTPKGKISSSTQTTLLPVKRDGTLDYSAIVE